jgi:CubicO group peptidase (beta-lactamase class C family)
MKLIVGACFLFVGICLLIRSKKRAKLRTMDTAKPKSHYRRFTEMTEPWFGIIYVLFGAWCFYSASLSFAGAETTAPVSLLEPGTTSPLQMNVQRRASAFFARRQPVGLVVGVLDGDTSFAVSYGTARFRAKDTPNSATLFEIGSITKTFTATAFARMVNDGRMKLDQPLAEALTTKVQKNGRDITLLDLATHSSGLPRLPFGAFHMILPSNWDDPYISFTNKNMEQWLSEYSPSRKPGDKFEYSNAGVGLLGWALSKRDGCSYEQMITREVIEPLDLRDTAQILNEEKRRRFAHGYSSRITTGVLRLATENHPWDFCDSMAGCGALRSSVRDLLVYAHANLGHVDSPMKEAVELAHKPKFNVNEVTSIGLAWMKTTRKDWPAPVLWHNGGTGGFRSLIALSPSHDCAVVVLTNCVEDSLDGFGFQLLNSIVRSKGTK